MSGEIETRDYQVIAVNAVVEKLQTSSRTQLHMAPGTGKTIVSLLVKESIDPSLTVVFVPTIQLVHQQFDAWDSVRKTPYRSLAIASDAPVRSKQDNPDYVGNTTKTTVIAKFINSKGRRTIFCTYMSAPILIEAMAMTKRYIDLAIFDEAHRVSGSYEKRAVKLLNDKIIKIRKRLFMTATPKILRNSKDVIEIAGMDDISKFGEVAYTLSFREAVDSKILVDYQVVAATVTEDDLGAIDSTKSHEDKITLAAISKVIEFCELKKGLTFHNSIVDAKRYSILLRDYLSSDVYVDTLNSSHSSKHRSKVLTQVKSSEQSVLTNVRVLGEGFDFSALDYIVFVDPKNSPVDIIQNIGRVMRKHEEKDMGIIVVPIFVKNSSNVDDCQIDTSKFSSIFRIASCLGSIDAMFATLLDYGSNSNFRRQTDFNVRQFMSDHIKVVGIDPVDKEYVKSMEEKIKLLFVTGSKREFNNELMLRKLKKFCETHNRLPSRVKPEELSLFYFTSLVHVQTASPETKAMIQPIVDKFGTKKIDLPIEDQFSILEKWVRENKRFPYYGYGRSKQSRKELFEAKGMTITDEELYLRQWMTYKIANKKFTPELKERLSDLKEWVSEVSPTIAQLVKKHNLCSSSSALKQKLVKLGVEPHYCSPGNRPTVLWDIEKVRAALNLP